VLADDQAHQVRRIAGDLELFFKAVSLGIRDFGGSELAVGGGVKVLGNIAGGIEGAHAKVEVDLRVGSVEADAGKRFGTDNDLVARRLSAGNDDWVRGDGKRGWKEGVEAGGVA
jgi:hypothetical protein